MGAIGGDVTMNQTYHSSTFDPGGHRLIERYDV